MAAPVPPTDLTSLKTSHFTHTIVLNRIFKLILNMTTSLQAAAAAQAKRLTFLTSWQKAYTDALSQVHAFLGTNSRGSGGDWVSVTDSEHGVIRDELNRLNSSFTQIMQNRQSLVADEAKALQSAINQSNDAVNQQANLGTAIIQELSTLLSAIYH